MYTASVEDQGKGNRVQALSARATAQEGGALGHLSASLSLQDLRSQQNVQAFFKHKNL